MASNRIMLSVIIPVYNMEKYVGRCLDSVVKAQMRLMDPLEVLIINDGSQDSSKEIIERYCNQYEYMKLYNKENGGLSDVKNYGLERAEGRFVTFLDSDDYIEPNMYKEMIKKIKDECADVVVCGVEQVYDDSSKNHKALTCTTIRNDLFSNLVDTNLSCASWNKIVKRELYDGLVFPCGMNNEDVAVTPIILARAEKIAYIGLPFYKYYQRIGSIQNSIFDERRFVILETVKICLDRAKSLEENRIKTIKGSLYVHQVLAVAYYLIRKQKLRKRIELLRMYMNRVEELFSDFWKHEEIGEWIRWERGRRFVARAISISLLKRRKYTLVSLYWSISNMY